MTDRRAGEPEPAMIDHDAAAALAPITSIAVTDRRVDELNQALGGEHAPAPDQSYTVANRRVGDGDHAVVEAPPAVEAVGAQGAEAEIAAEPAVVTPEMRSVHRGQRGIYDFTF